MYALKDMKQYEAQILEDSIKDKKDQIYGLMAGILKDAIKLRDEYGYSEDYLKKLGEL